MLEMRWIHNLGIHKNIPWVAMELCWQHGVYIPWGSIETYPENIWHHEITNVHKNTKVQ